MIDPTSMLLGPLATPECSRAARRGWLIWVRLFPAIASCVVGFVVLWIWWIGQQIDPYHQPFFELHLLSLAARFVVACKRDGDEILVLPLPVLAAAHVRQLNPLEAVA